MRYDPKAERAEWERIEAAFKEREAICETHPVPPPRDGIVPRACTCYAVSPEGRAFFAWRSRRCNICGGVDKCRRSCDALDRR